MERFQVPVPEHAETISVLLEKGGRKTWYVKLPPRPADPNWEPDLILRDQPPPVRRPAMPPDPRLARRNINGRYASVQPTARQRIKMDTSNGIRAPIMQPPRNPPPPPLEAPPVETPMPAVDMSL